MKDKLKKYQGIKKKEPSEKEPGRELDQDLARADDDGFAIPKKNRDIPMLIS